MSRDYGSGCLFLIYCLLVVYGAAAINHGSQPPPPPTTGSIVNQTSTGGVIEGAPPPPPTKENVLDELEEDESVMDHIMKINYNPQQTLSSPPFTYTDDGGIFELFEGDILKNRQLEIDVDELKHGDVNKGVSDAINRGQWTNGVIPYVFKSYFSRAGRAIVASAIKVFDKHTCIKFRPRRSSDRNYVIFMHGGGCSSMIGMQGGGQQISLANGCLVVGIAVHEMVHAAGFYHEQSRRDRDNYIQIHWNNINRGMWYNFQKYQSGQASTLDEPYDKSSVMHYGNYAFSINGQKTIVSKSNYNEVLGQRRGLSDIDIKQLNKYYSCKNTGGGGGGGGTTLKKDKHQFCFLLLKFCEKDKWVTENCQKTCCVDKNPSCKYWQQTGYCKNSKHYNWMKLNCPKSCGYC